MVETGREQQAEAARGRIREARVMLRHAQQYLEVAQSGPLLPEQTEGVRRLIAEITAYLENSTEW